MGRFGRFVFRATVAIGVGTAAFDYTNCEVVSRSLRTLTNGAYVTYLYKTTEAESLEELSALHTKVAKIVLDTCLRNEGLYIKLGQGLSAINHVLPEEYIKTLQVLLDNAPQITEEEVFRIIREQTGKEAHDLFTDFDPVPVASASIAQVHKAKLRVKQLNAKTGAVEEVLQDVAVKVQKPNIPVQIDWDLYTHRIICMAIQYCFGLPTMWSAKTIEDNLLEEINFKKEAANANTIREQFVDLKNPDASDIYVPKVFDELLTERVMVSEWIDAVKLTQNEDVKNNFNTQKMMQRLCECYGDQIFKFGAVHADPHAANVMVRRKPAAAASSSSSSFCNDPQVVLLDFGLCIQESAKFRYEYASFFKAIFTQDTATLRKIAKEWGIGHADLFASMQLMKPFKSKKGKEDEGGSGGKVVPLHQQKISKKEVMEMQLLMKENAKTLLEHDHLVPQELIFVGRAMNILRSVNKSFNGPVNRVNILVDRAVASLPYTAPLALEESKREGARPLVLDPTLHISNATNGGSSIGGFATNFEAFKFRFTLTLLSFIYQMTQWYNTMLIIIVPKSIREKYSMVSLDELEEEREKEMAQKLGKHPLPKISTND